MHRGFSLIELSIVLVILGLLTGGILAGKSLIRASELRAVGTEYQRYVTATQAFRDKYFGLPGDFRDATRFWARQSSTNCVTNSSPAASLGTPGACDGDGDALVEMPGAPNVYGEIYQFWRQLALAGLIEGDYTGQAGSSNGVQHLLGTNHPASKLSNAGWAMVYTVSDGFLYTTDYGNIFFMGAPVTNSSPYGGTLTPAEMWNLDTKLDDGKPAYGKVLTWYWSSCGVADNGSTTQGNLDASYRVTDTRQICAPIFRKAF